MRRAAAAALLLAGCAVPMAPVRQDPLAGIDFESRPPAYPGLTLALVITENTKNSVAFGRAGAAYTGFDIEGSVEQSFKLYKRNFKAVVRVEQPSEAAAAGADLVAVVDRFVKVGMGFTMSAKTLLFDLEGKELAVLSSERSGRGGMMNPAGPVVQVTRAVDRDIEDQLRAAPALAELARRLAKAAPPAVPTAAAAAPARRPAALKPSYRVPERPDDLAIVVGVAKYPDLPEALHAEDDAEAVKEHLLALGVPRRNLIHLAGARATRTGLQKYVETWLANNVKPTSRVWFYFSGHGAPDPRTGDSYLVPSDGDPNYLAETGYPLRELYAKLAASGAREAVVALDACFSGAGGRSVLAKGARPLVVRREAPEAPPATVTVLAAAAEDQITAAYEEGGHGLFTWFLLKGLDGAARDAGGRVTAAGLHRWLSPKVADEARRQNREQTPAFAGADLTLRD